jgi:hypothetical protein
MPSVAGNLKSKKLTLQGSVANKDFDLRVADDQLEIRRDNKVLMSVGQDDELNDSNTGEVENEITISVPVTFEDNINVKGSLAVEDKIPNAVLARKNTLAVCGVGVSAGRYPSLHRGERYENEQQNYIQHTSNGFISEINGFKYFVGSSHTVVGDYYGQRLEDFARKNVKDVQLKRIHDTSLMEGDKTEIMNDCWGHEFVEKVWPDGWSFDANFDGWGFGPKILKKQYAAVGDSLGLGLYDITPVNPACDIGEPTLVERWKNAVTNSWADAKSYTVTTCTMEGDLSGIKSGDFLQWKFDNHHFKYNMEVLTVDGQTIRGKTMWPVIEDCVDKECSSHSGVVFKSGSRQEFMYWGKDGGSLHVMDMANLRGTPTTDAEGVTTIDRSNRGVVQVQRYEPNSITVYPVDDTTGDPNMYPFTAGHNEYVDEITGILYNVSDSNGTTLLDIKADPSTPKVIGKMNAQHDMHTKSYSREEQNIILGVPEAECTDNMVLCVGADTNIYTYDVTDPTNVLNIGQCPIPGYPDGYTHAGWFTSDKRFYISHQENSGDNKADYYGAAFVIKMMYNSETQKVVPKLVQIYKNDVPGHGHNNYCVSNIDPKYRKVAFEDYVFHANYDAGTRVFKLNYKSYYDKADIQNTDEPFDVEEVAFFDSGSTLGHGDLFGTWSCFPFALGTDSAGTASNNRCISSGQDGFQVFTIQDKSAGVSGISHTKLPDKNKDGSLTLLAKGPVRITANIGGISLVTKDGEQNPYVEQPYNMNVVDPRLDIFNCLIPKLVGIEEDNINMLTVDDIGAVSKGEMVYCETTRGFIAGQVLKESESRLESKSDDVGFGWKEQPQARNVFSRIDELVTTLPCIPGDSGSPVYNKDGKIVGMVRDSDGSNVGVTKLIPEMIGGGQKKIIKSSGIQKTNIKAFKGVWNERMAGRSTNDPYAFWAPYIHPASGKIQGYMSGSGTNYNILGLQPSVDKLDTSLPGGGLPLGEGMTVNEYAYIDALTSSSLNSSNTFVFGGEVYPSWFWNFKPYPYFNNKGPSAIPLTSPDVPSGEYLKGNKSSEGPMVFVLDKYVTSEGGAQETYVVDGVTHYMYVVFPVSKFQDPDNNEALFEDQVNAGYGSNKTNHAPEGGDTMTSDSGVVVTVGKQADGSDWTYKFGQSLVPMSLDYADAENPYLTERYTKLFLPEFLNSNYIAGEDCSGFTAFLPHYANVEGGMPVRGKGDVDNISGYAGLNAENTLDIILIGSAGTYKSSYLGLELFAPDNKFENITVRSRDPAFVNEDGSGAVPFNKKIVKFNGEPFVEKSIKDIYLTPPGTDVTMEFAGDETVYTIKTQEYCARSIPYV